MLTTIVFNPAEGTPQEVIDGFEEAGDIWESLLFDDVTVNIDISFPDLGDNITLGTTDSIRTTESYFNISRALRTDSTSPDDESAVANLQPEPAFSIYINGTADNPNGAGSEAPYVDDDGGANNITLRLTNANARALGLLSGAGMDAEIVFNSQVNWDFDSSDGIDPNAYDIVSVALHEIGHALGFSSGVNTLSGLVERGESFNEDELIWVHPLDLFRYSADSLAQGRSVIDFTLDARSKFFSIDGGATQLGTFATGLPDDGQASHWEELSVSLGLMDVNGEQGEQTDPNELDLQALDVIGWDLVAADSAEISVSVGDFSRTVVGGTVFEDDGDGIQSPMEPGVPGRMVFGDANSDGSLGFGETAVMTDELGNWQISMTDMIPFGNPPTETFNFILVTTGVTVSPNPDDPSETFARTHELTLGSVTNDIDFGIQFVGDLGDAPHDGASYFYPTTMAQGGAYHHVINNFYLGATVDGESDGKPHPGAMGDDAALSDDDDGVTFSKLIPGSPAAVTVTGGPAAPVGYFHLWIDYNRDGDWDDSGEYVLAAEKIVDGTVNLPFNVPGTADTGPTFARARLSFESTLGPSGVSTGGEVEDYMVMLGDGDELLPAVANPISLGDISFVEMLGEDLTAGAAYQLVANRTGIFTVEALFDHHQGDLNVSVFNPDGLIFASSNSADEAERVDFFVHEGQTYLTYFEGSNPSVDIRLANLVTQHVGTVRYAEGVLPIATTNPIELSINDVTYEFDSRGSSIIMLQESDVLDEADIGDRWLARGERTVNGENFNKYAKRLTTVLVADSVATTVGLLGDVVPDGSIDSVDIDSLYDAIEAGSTEAIYDLNFDGDVTQKDIGVLVRNVLGTTYGDTDLDGDVDIFDITTLIGNFAPISSDSSWGQGDFDGDGDTDITDVIQLVVNFSPFGNGTPYTPTGDDASTLSGQSVNRTEATPVSVSNPAGVLRTAVSRSPASDNRLAGVQPAQPRSEIVVPPPVFFIDESLASGGSSAVIQDEETDELTQAEADGLPEIAAVDDFFAEQNSKLFRTRQGG